MSYQEEVFSNKFDVVQSFIERLPGLFPPIMRNAPDSYANTHFTDEIALIIMPKSSLFRIWECTTELVIQTITWSSTNTGLCGATMCKGFGSTLTRLVLKSYIDFSNGSIYSFAALTDQFVEPRKDVWRYVQNPSTLSWTSA